jgi:tryptophan synthase alpha chain
VSKNSAITEVFSNAQTRDEAVLIVYITAGFPNLDRSMELIESSARSGADIIEIGIPFSDPVADGPSIQYASHSALGCGISLRAVLDALRDLTLGKPLVIMSYLNPIFAFGWSRMLDVVEHTHVSGLIIPDLPVEEAEDWSTRSSNQGLDLILLAAPTSSPMRLKQIAELSQGFIYCVSTTGTTGLRETLSNGITDFVSRIRSVTTKPCAIGFGISKPEHVRSLRNDFDGIIIGSRIIEGIRKQEDIPALINSMKEATRR